MICTDYELSIERMLADEIGESERERLLSHAEGCDGCRALVDLHHRMLGPELDVELPTEGEFAAMRSAVLDQVAPRDSDAPSHGGFWSLFGWRPIQAAGLAAVMLATFAVGSIVGRRAGDAQRDAAVLDGLREEARTNVVLADVEDSPYVYSNVSFRDGEGGSMELSFDVTRHLEIRRPKDDPLVKEILVQSLLNPSPVGTRLAAISQAGGMMDPKVRQALILSLFNDESQAVRMRSLEILSSAKDDPEVRSAILAVLRGEESVQMRLMAMDLLAESDMSVDQYTEIVDMLRARDDRALQVRAASYAPRGAGGDSR